MSLKQKIQEFEEAFVNGETSTYRERQDILSRVHENKYLYRVEDSMFPFYWESLGLDQASDNPKYNDPTYQVRPGIFTCHYKEVAGIINEITNEHFFIQSPTKDGLFHDIRRIDMGILFGWNSEGSMVDVMGKRNLMILIDAGAKISVVHLSSCLSGYSKKQSCFFRKDVETVMDVTDEFRKDL